MTEFLARELPGSGLTFKPSQNGALTYHDPCRLGRGSGLRGLRARFVAPPAVGERDPEALPMYNKYSEE